MIQLDVVAPPPVRTDIPGGRPLAIPVNGAAPPLKTPTPREHGTPIVQSARKFP